MVFWKRKRATTDQETTSPGESNTTEIAAGITSPNDGTKVATESSPTPSASESPAKGASWWSRVLSKTNELLRTDIRDLWKSEGELVDEDFLKNLYAILIRTDMGNSMA
ncbi:MAG: hypothetical protein ACK5N9_19020, partial [Pirellula sp.]